MAVLISSSLKDLTSTPWWLQTAKWIQNLLFRKPKSRPSLKATAGGDIQPSLLRLLHLSSSFDTNLNEKVKQGTC